MVPDSRNMSRKPIQRLLETEEKGRDIALFGWAGVAVFCCLAAFASWQFSPQHSAMQVARFEQGAAGDITGTIKPTSHSQTGQVPTVPTPLPDDTGLDKGELSQLRSELKDLRRVVGRIDMSTDVLARRLSNLEDSITPGSGATNRPSASSANLPPIASTGPAPAAAMPSTNPPPSSSGSVSQTASVPAAPAPQPPAATQPTPAVPPAAQSPATQTPVTPAPAARAPVPQPLGGGVVMIPTQAVQGVSVVPQNVQRPVTPLPPSPADRAAADKAAADRATLERMLLQRSQALDPDTAAASGSLIPPLPEPITVMPKSHAAPVTPPMPAPPPMAQGPAKPDPAAQAVAKPEPHPVADAATTGSVADRPVLPIDPTKAVTVRSAPAPAPMVQAMADTPKPVESARPAEQFGIDLGGYKSLVQVKKFWSDLDLRDGKLTKALTPLARLGESGDGVDIRVIAGPFADKEQAVRTCHQLRGAQAVCEPVAYSGEPILPKTASAADRRLPSGTVTEPVKRAPLKLDVPHPTVTTPQVQ